jgi:hypothetical protein
MGFGASLVARDARGGIQRTREAAEKIQGCSHGGDLRAGPASDLAVGTADREPGAAATWDSGRRRTGIRGDGDMGFGATATWDSGVGCGRDSVPAASGGLGRRRARVGPAEGGSQGRRRAGAGPATEVVGTC